jgi:hypothetical protein
MFSVCRAGAVVVVSHSLRLLQEHQQPLQQCTALFSQLQSFLQGKRLPQHAPAASRHLNSCSCIHWRTVDTRSCMAIAPEPQLQSSSMPSSCRHNPTSIASSYVFDVPPAAAVKSVEVASSDWGSAMADFRKRFDTQLKQELSDHGSSITGEQTKQLRCRSISSCQPWWLMHLCQVAAAPQSRCMLHLQGTMCCG